MAKQRIEKVAKPGTQEYLLLLLACEIQEEDDGSVSEADVEHFLATNPDEAEYFDEDVVARVRNQLRIADNTLHLNDLK